MGANVLKKTVEFTICRVIKLCHETFNRSLDFMLKEKSSGREKKKKANCRPRNF